MKKKISLVAIVTAASALLALSCTETEGGEGIIVRNGTMQVRVDGIMGEYVQDREPETRAGLVSNIRVAWEDDDEVFVYDGTGCLGSLSAAIKDGDDRVAVLGGTISVPADGTEVLTLVYCPSVTSAPAVSDGKISFDLSSQSDAATPFVVYGTMAYDGTGISDAVIPFKFATSVMKVNWTGLAAGVGVSSATISGLNTVCTLSLSPSAAPTVSGGTSGTVLRSGEGVFSTSADGRGSFQVAIVASPSSAGRSLVITDASGSDSESAFTSSALGAGKSFNTVYAMEHTVGTVDLGLPSGLLWGKKNVGDEALKGGLGYSWGETFSKGTFEYYNNIYYKVLTEDWKKYSFLSDLSHNDNNTLLDPSDDAATVNLGSGWRTPTYLEWLELLEYCEATPQTQGGIRGVLLTSKVSGYEDASIFLPSDRNYWSSTFKVGLDDVFFYPFDDFAYGCRFDYMEDMLMGISPVPMSRFDGNYIRPVRSELVAAESLSIENLTVNAGNTAALQVTLSPSDCSEKGVVYDISDPDVAIVDWSGKVIGRSEGTMTVTAYWADDASVTSSCTVTVTGMQVAQAVDLGLESGTRWASFNLGAASEYQLGTLFSWAGTDYKFLFEMGNYEHASGDQYIKYTASDGKTTIEASDDAATRLWGTGWSIPSREDWEELANSCDISWDNSLKCFVVEGPNGNSIRIMSPLYPDPEWEWYMIKFWTSTLSSSYLTDACYMVFSKDLTPGYESESYYVSAGFRYDGNYIRPVYKPVE